MILTTSNNEQSFIDEVFVNGREIEHLLMLIDHNIAVNSALMRVEVFEYLKEHPQEVLQSLRSTKKALIPTSSGAFTMTLEELQAAAA